MGQCKAGLEVDFVRAEKRSLFRRQLDRESKRDKTVTETKEEKKFKIDLGFISFESKTVKKTTKTTDNKSSGNGGVTRPAEGAIKGSHSSRRRTSYSRRRRTSYSSRRRTSYSRRRRTSYSSRRRTSYSSRRRTSYSSRRRASYSSRRRTSYSSRRRSSSGGGGGGGGGWRR